MPINQISQSCGHVPGAFLYLSTADLRQAVIALCTWNPILWSLYQINWPLQESCPCTQPPQDKHKSHFTSFQCQKLPPRFTTCPKAVPATQRVLKAGFTPQTVPSKTGALNCAPTAGNGELHPRRKGSLPKLSLQLLRSKQLPHCVESNHKKEAVFRALPPFLRRHELP